ncbi:hypothetical protein K438DRAFT_1750361 [Mycena galopus ATCC 62051]|nr:hypothetical protein K438DRAFT_1750361 [Mycena galopus ATCC 62051]
MSFIDEIFSSKRWNGQGDVVRPLCIIEEDPRGDESDGNSKDERDNGEVDGRASSADWDVVKLGGSTMERGTCDAAGSAQRPNSTAVHFRQHLGMRSSTPGHFLMPRPDTAATSLQLPYLKTRQWKDMAGTAEAWEEVVRKAQASPTSGRSIRAREMAVREPSHMGLQRHLEEGRAGPHDLWELRASLYVDVGTRLGDSTKQWAGTGEDVTLCDISGLGRQINQVYNQPVGKSLVVSRVSQVSQVSGDFERLSHIRLFSFTMAFSRAIS